MSGNALRHPVRSVEHEAEHLREIAREGDSAATPLILIGTWIVVAALVVTLAVTLAHLGAHLLASQPPRSP